jgi:flagellar hook-associated protein 2
MASITSLGIGSGLDLNNLVSQLVSLQRQPLQQMDANARKLQGQVSTYGQVKSLFSGLQDASNRLTSPTLWTQTLARSSKESAVAVSGSSSAAAGSYAVSVQSLAGGQTLASGAVFAAATDTVGAGTLTLQRGRWNEGVDAFTAGSGVDAVNIDITADDTLQTVRDRINASGAGVLASLVTDASGVRLALRSTDTGADNGFRITTDSSDPAGLARLAFDPEGAAGGTGGMQLKLAAQDARATVNGIEIVSASNELTGTIEGLTLRLREVTATPVDITVATDTEAVTTAVKGFADAYNALAKFIADQTKYDAATKVGGALQGDSAMTGLQRQLRTVLGATSGASTVYPRLSDIGLELQRDGTVKLNDSKLGEAMKDLPALRRAFANSDSAEPQNNGFARRYAQLAQQVLATDGSIETRTQGLRTRIDKISDDKDRLNDRVDAFQARLVQQYTAMDANVARLNAINSYLTQQLAQLAKIGSSK